MLESPRRGHIISLSAAYFRVDNVLDDDAFEADNFLPSRPRTVTLGVRLNGIEL